MLTIDAQVHAYGRNHPGRPWHAVPAGPPEVTGEEWR
jgi:L-fuconolactonase